MRSSDWSSDVCSSDLAPAFEARWTPERVRGDGAFAGLAKAKTRLKGCPAGAGFRRRRPLTPPPPDPPPPPRPRHRQDWKSVGKGKSVSVRVDLGGRRTIQKKQ